MLLEKATTVAGFPTEEQIYIVLKCYDRNEAVYADDDGNGSWLDAYDRHHWAPLIEQAVYLLPSLLDIADERDRLRAELAKTPAWLGGRLMALNTVRLHHGLLSGEFTSLWEKTLDELAALAAGAAPEPQEGGR